MLYLRMILLLSLLFMHNLGQVPKTKNCDSADMIKDLEDVMGEYTGLTKEQCRRLCWYRRLCHSFSARTEGVAKDAITCILHAQGCADDGVFETRQSWQRAIVTAVDIQNGCANRPCDQRQVCVPTFEVHKTHTCLPYPAVCQAPRGEQYTVTGGQTGGPHKQGEFLTVHSDADPSHDSTIECQVTSRWSKPVRIPSEALVTSAYKEVVTSPYEEVADIVQNG